jgi:hypothetical protein
LNDDQPWGDSDFENWKVEFFNNAKEKDISRDLEHLTTADRTIILLWKRCDLQRPLGWRPTLRRHPGHRKPSARIVGCPI